MKKHQELFWKVVFCFPILGPLVWLVASADTGNLRGAQIPFIRSQAPTIVLAHLIYTCILLGIATLTI